MRGLWNKYVDDYKVFLWGQESQGDTVSLQGICYTLNEHAKANESPAQLFPRRPHLEALADLWATQQTLIIFKSRQMLVSWLLCSLILWDSLKPGRRWLVCCKEFTAANELLDRMWFIYERLPKALRPRAEKKQGYITLYHKDAKSVIQAAAQTSDAPRSQTFSGILIDEMEFTDNAAALHTAAMPTIMGGGKFVGISTPNGKGYGWQLATEDGVVALDDFVDEDNSSG